jgi:Family of unknown function (DUF6326)
MSSIASGSRVLEDLNVPVKLKLAALWTATMFLFAYGDIFSLYRSETIEDVMAGELGGFEVNQAFLVAITIYVSIPSVMVFLSLILRPEVNRWTNVILGSVYAVTIVLSVIGEGWAYFIFFSALEVVLVLLIVRYAWKWPEQPRVSVPWRARPTDPQGDPRPRTEPRQLLCPPERSAGAAAETESRPRTATPTPAPGPARTRPPPGYGRATLSERRAPRSRCTARSPGPPRAAPGRSAHRSRRRRRSCPRRAWRGRGPRGPR